VIVVDASVLVTALADDTGQGRAVRAELAAGPLAAPGLVDLEVASALRSMVSRLRMPAERAVDALADLADLPVRRAPHVPLLARCWDLRDNLTVYDAAYVALAEALEVVLVTADERLARAPGLRCDVRLLTRPPRA
jgi:predicted nucleic acid-binding protein